MKTLSDMTGGILVMTDSCKNAVFKKSFVKLFERDSAGQLKIGTSASLNLLCSQGIKVCGIVGHCTSLKKKSNNVSDMIIGVGQTNAWNFGGIDKDSTYAFFFEITNTSQLNSIAPIYIQFLTRYLHSSGHFRLRITTVRRMMPPGEDLKEISRGFDQEAAAVIVARYAVHRTMTGEETIDVLRSLDRMLIKLVARFGDCKRGDSQNFRMPKEFQLYPQFMYHLRRSQYIQTFGESPDESCYYRDILLKETTSNSLLMIQPALLQYTVESPEASPVLLEMSSMKPNVILLYDTFFHVLIWHGETIAKWRDANFQAKPEYENVKILLETPVEDAEVKYFNNNLL
jgi:protein transport protein SEC23